MLKQRQRTPPAKTYSQSLDFSKLRVGPRPVENVLLKLGTYKNINSNYGDKTFVLNAIYRHDYKQMREISNYFYEASGIYCRLCKYLATLYKYDWYVIPYVKDAEKASENKVLNDFSKVLEYLDNSNIKSVLNNIALDVIVDGVYYGMILDNESDFSIQKLPAQYCRCRYFSKQKPIIELNLSFFDSEFSNPQYKAMILKTFPKDIQQAYILFKQDKLKGDYPGSNSYWYPLDPDICVRIALNDKEFPAFIGTIPSIIDLDQAQELDRQKTMQQLLKIIVQKLPLDKNSELIFDMDEAETIHNNAVAMLKRAVGLDVLTTFADVDVINTKDSDSNTSRDDLEKVERTVFNNAGVSHNMFNTDGNLATTNAILSDEASVRDLPQQFQMLLNRIAQKFNKKQYTFRVEMLETTQYNYKELAKAYKEQTQLGFSKILPQIALGHSQSGIYASLVFENKIMHLADIMIPPMSSNTMSNKSGKSDQENQNKIQDKQTENGRPEKPDSEKSDKTILNKESQ